MRKTIISSIISIGLTLLSNGCSRQSNKQEVVIYTSVDQVYSSRILRQFEKETGIKVKAVFDAEASKAVGLEQRLLTEKNRPKADIFWNSEFMRTARLARQGVFEPYAAQTVKYSDTDYFSPEKMWYGLGGRARVFIVNKKKISPEDYPAVLTDLLAPRFKGNAAISTPFSGSTSTHFAALYNKFGQEHFVHFLQGIKDNKVALLAGNSVVKDAVGHGRFAVGLVDTDDALVGIEQGLPIEMVYYDQDGEGVFSIFQTVALVKNAPNRANAKKFIGYLLREHIERELIKMKAVQFSILTDNSSEKTPKIWVSRADEIASSLQASTELIRKHLD